MKTTLSMLILFTAAHLSFMAYATRTPSERLLNAIRQVESGGRNVTGDGGKAVGVYQLHKCVVDDVNRIYKTKYQYIDRQNEAKSRQIARLYLKHYGKGLSQLEQARVFNGGPRGHKKESTIKYAMKIERAMK